MTEVNRSLITRYFWCLDRHDLESASALQDPEWRIHGLARHSLGLEEWLQRLDALFEGFPDARFTIHATVAEGDRVAVRHTFSGTHLATFCDVPPTERKVQVNAAMVAELRQGRIHQEWLNADFLSLLRQLGVVPKPVA